MSAKHEQSGADVNQDMMISTGRLYAPVGLIITAFLALGTVVWNSSARYTEINKKIEDQSTEIETLRKTMERIESFMSQHSKGRAWTYEDHLVWCLRTQIANPEWKCDENFVKPRD